MKLLEINSKSEEALFLIMAQNTADVKTILFRHLVNVVYQDHNLSPTQLQTSFQERTSTKKFLVLKTCCMQHDRKGLIYCHLFHHKH